MKQPREFHVFRPWLEFVLIFTLGPAVLRTIIVTVMEPYLTRAEASSAQMALAEWIVAICTALPISYFAFCYVVREFLSRDRRKDDATPRI